MEVNQINEHSSKLNYPPLFAFFLISFAHKSQKTLNINRFIPKIDLLLIC